MASMSTDKTIVKVSDKSFKNYITHDRIQKSLSEIAVMINSHYRDKNPVFLIVLNGAFMFASDLLKCIDIPCEVSFLRVSSYFGMESSNKITEVLGLDETLKGKHVVVVEDIVDTGHTMEYILKSINEKGVLSIKIATLLFKKNKFVKDFPIDYICFSIPNDFVVGYGLDYNGLGRNLKDLYSVIEDVK
jgi:hypoxanthine phosphoribosyltransferase